MLEEKLGSEETELERQVAQAIDQDMEARLDQRYESRKSGERATFPREAVDQEVKRQLRELFGNYDQD